MSAGCHHHHHHGHDDKTEGALNWTLGVNIVLLVTVVAAAVVTRSSAIMAEGIHRLFDAVNPLLLWLGYRRSRRPSCDKHPLGHAREEFTYSLAAAVLMLSCGAGVAAYRGIDALVSGHVPEHSLTWLIVMGTAALLGEGFSLYKSLKALPGGIHGIRKSKNMTVLGVVFENFVDIVGVTLALAGYGLFLWTGQPIWDGLASLAIAALMGYSSVFLIRRNISLLTGEVVEEETGKQIAESLSESLTVFRVERVVAVMHGPRSVHCWVSVSVDREALGAEMSDDGPPAVEATLDRIAREKELLRSTLREKNGQIDRIDIDCS